VLALCAAAAWGSGDFGGGLLSRRTPVFGVVLVSQLVGLACVAALAALRGEAWPTPDDVRLALLAGVCGGFGIMALYRGLAIGRMGVVAPITGVLAAVIPVGVGFLFEGVPSAFVLAGIAVALVAVLLVSRSADNGGGRAGLPEAVVAGVLIGAFGVTVSRITDGAVFTPLTIIRAVQIVIVVTVVLVTRSAWRPASRLLPGIAAIGVADMAGNLLYFLAIQTGALAIAAVLSSLYPVVTVILAAVLLREPVSREHALGIGLAAVAIVLIGAGSV
jgi:drug/metabolite transporter (DMT)-like permease